MGSGKPRSRPALSTNCRPLTSRWRPRKVVGTAAMASRVLQARICWPRCTHDVGMAARSGALAGRRDWLQAARRTRSSGPQRNLLWIEGKLLAKFSAAAAYAHRAWVFYLKFGQSRKQLGFELFCPDRHVMINLG